MEQTVNPTVKQEHPDMTTTIFRVVCEECGAELGESQEKITGGWKVTYRDVCPGCGKKVLWDHRTYIIDEFCGRLNVRG